MCQHLSWFPVQGVTGKHNTCMQQHFRHQLTSVMFMWWQPEEQGGESITCPNTHSNTALEVRYKQVYIHSTISRPWGQPENTTIILTSNNLPYTQWAWHLNVWPATLCPSNESTSWNVWLEGYKYPCKKSRHVLLKITQCCTCLELYNLLYANSLSCTTQA